MGVLDGKTGFVTGAASGLGRAIAHAFVAAGGRVLLSDIDEAGGEETRRQIDATGGAAHFTPCDVTDTAQVSAAIEQGIRLFGRLDCAVNNAGIEGPLAKIGDYEADAWHAIIAVNLTGIFHCVQAELKVMRAQRSGSIVNIASVAGLGGVKLMPAYAASKHGVIGLTKSAALGHAAENIRVNAVCPGSFLTAMSSRIYGEQAEETMTRLTPMRRIGDVAEIAAAAIWLCSDASSFVTGTALPVDGGKRAQ